MKHEIQPRYTISICGPTKGVLAKMFAYLKTNDMPATIAVGGTVRKLPGCSLHGH